MRWPYALRSLAHRNLRLFFAGQCVSLVGSWMQSVAQGWLVYRLTRSSEMLGLIGFLSQIPVFLFGAWAGSLADRFPRRRVVIATQANALLQASLLAVLTFTGAVRPWHLLVLAFMLGLSYAFEIPARQALLGEIAGPDMPNALALNSSIVNGARIAGPALAGWLVAAVGEGWCFALNALSFLGTLRALWVMDVQDRPPPAAAAGSHLREGLAYAWRTPMVRGGGARGAAATPDRRANQALLALVAASSIFGMAYLALIPVFAAEVLGGGARLFGVLQACTGAGALAGALALLARSGIRGLGRQVALGASAFGVGLAIFSLSRVALLSGAALAVVGIGYITQMAGAMTLLQGLAPEEMRGRVMGLFSTLFVGMSPFGALAGGFLAERFGAPRTLFAGSLVVLAASLAFHAALPRLRRTVVSPAAAPAPQPATPAP
jgi:MFS family permease